ncbi:acyl carrier protein [Marinitenerispora sediminis]|uniref:acyl carrier protein n=1 Tax=Marinitenerispora sediminis TaxID=1931232 RepID=UPI000DF1A5B4|nr:acyl carrier protein [Marinitenerispora sediminis]RCV60097.1 phosphopantetheine-binding protein [Marinitenerispora sediminis]
MTPPPDGREAALDQLTTGIIAALAAMVRREPESMSTQTRLFEDLGFDSTTALELLMRLEDDFGFHADPETLAQHHFETIGSLTDYVLEQAGV